MKKVALVTSADYPNLSQDDLLLLEPLDRMGISPCPVIWSDASVDWGSYSLIVVRSIWDYYKHLQEFYSWLDKIEGLKVPVWNDTSVIRWNIDKSLYLKDLRDREVQIIPTLFLKKGSSVLLRNLLEENGWDEAIVKPAFGGSGFGIFKTSVNSAKADQRQFDELIKNSPVLVQKFMKEIFKGEYSLIFIGGKFSHAVLKSPQPGEYRINKNFGGIWTDVSVSGSLVSEARNILNVLDKQLLYARVDVFDVGGQLVLNELEIVDPSLFLGLHNGAADLFAEEIEELVK